MEYNQKYTNKSTNNSTNNSTNLSNTNIPHTNIQLSNKQMLERIANSYFENENNNRNKILDYINNTFK